MHTKMSLDSPYVELTIPTEETETKESTGPNVVGQICEAVCGLIGLVASATMVAGMFYEIAEIATTNETAIDNVTRAVNLSEAFVYQ